MEEILPSVYIDGAHNPDGMRAFLESAGQIIKSSSKNRRTRRFLLFSCVRDKMYREELRMIRQSGLFTDIAAVPMEGARALRAQELIAEIGENAHGIRIHQMDSVEDAVNRLILHKEDDMEVFAAGSLYLIGEIRDLILKHTAQGAAARR
jgi:dihydrofolate synthase/folylpolyglutamate synthase